MVIAEAVPPAWLRALTDAAAVLLLIELMVLLLIVAALIGALAFGARWLQMHVVPVLNATVPRAKQAMNVANQGTERVIRGVAEVYGIRKALETGVQILLRGRQGAGTAQLAQNGHRTPFIVASDARGQSPARGQIAAQPAATGATDSARAVASEGELIVRPRATTRSSQATEDDAVSDRDLNNMAANAG